ncbi:TIGR04086 family membrane protein [Laedolimicola sp.]|uniref:TIGR04086 family membrane protein n=1 Tax=Laedolimicola sp. TaxID=2981663 RepID=UPI003F81F394
MEKMKHYQGAAMRLLKALLAAYIATGGLLLLLALLLYKLRLSESVINLSITAIYLIACFLAGFLMGKMMKTRKYLWGAAGGLLYFTLLALISLAARQGSAEASSFITTLLLCTAGGTLGGMLS